MTRMSPDFRKLVGGALKGEVVIPLLRAALWNPEFQVFEIKVGGVSQRRPDGWFHPSVHPLWDERLLYYYLSHADRIVPEPLDQNSTLAITQGNFWHAVIGQIGMKHSIFKGVDVPVQDEETLARGEMDWLLDGEVGELKTMRSLRMAKIHRGAPDDQAVVDSLRALVPEYYAQGQEYMRLSGLRKWRGVFIAIEYPFEMREIVMNYDYSFAKMVREKYLRVRQAVADQYLPNPCCSARSKESKQCPARSVCPVAAI